MAKIDPSALKITRDLDGLTDASLYPLNQPAGKLLQRGREFEVHEYGSDWVLKRGVHPQANTLSQLRQDKEDHKCFKSYFNENLPPTYHFRAVDANGQESNCLLQRRVKGRHLYELSDEELREPKLRSNMLEFLKAIGRMWRQIGRVPDLCRKRGSWRRGLFDDVRLSRNIMTDKDKQVWLVDTSANPLVFSKKAILRYKYVPYLLMLSARRLQKVLL